MSVVDARYLQIKPEINYLSDEVVLSQAWKKSHAYIRSHNWYADTLELDCSAVNVAENIGDWGEQLRVGSYVPSPMRLIPAPKADHWSFFCSNPALDRWEWGPKKKEVMGGQSKELRPLAHLTIQDQTVATAIMLCLADCVESAQGNTDTQAFQNVRSYGNRLFCDWEGHKAKFRWGTSSTYSKYFQDYQRFLERPVRRAHDRQRYLFLGREYMKFI